jgi:hypothetical protein
MLSPASPTTPGRVIRSRPDTPNTNSPSTPETRKRQRVDYLRLHNGPPRGASPTPLSPQQITAPSAPVARMLPPSRPRIRQPRTRPSGRQNTPLFLPERDPILAPSSTVINVDSNTPGSQPRESGINKHAWWWKHFNVQLLNTKFLKGKKGNKREEVWNEHWTCNVTSNCTFHRYADKCHTATTALRDHIIIYHRLTEDTDASLAIQNYNSQGDIRVFMSKEADNPTFENALLDWITFTNKPFNVTESKWFTRMIRAAGWKDWIPKADTVRNRLEGRIGDVVAEISRDIKATSTTICLTLDGWTSQNNLGMLAINIKWLDSNFRRHQHSIEFMEVQGSHSGENMSYIVLDALKRHDCCHKLLTITGDNAENNDTLCLHLLQQLLQDYDDYLDPFPSRGAAMRFRGEESRIRCFAHVLNLIVKKILETLGSSTYKSAKSFLDLVAKSIAEGRTSRLSIPLGQGVIAKLRLIVLWIDRSTQRIQEWNARSNVTKRVNYDVDTRWNSTLRMIDDAFDCRAALNDSCDQIEALKDLKLSIIEWSQLDLIRTILRPFFKFTEYCSREQPSIQMLARMYGEVGVLLRYIAQQKGEFARIDDGLVQAVEAGRGVFDKYYRYMLDSNIFFIATVLDPRIKTKWIQQNVENPDEVIERIRVFLKATYPPPDPDLPTHAEDEAFQSLEYQFVAPFLDQSSADTVENDIDTYLDTPCIKYFGPKTIDQSQWVLDWWNANKSQYTCMACVAREFLAIPASEVDCERLFNEGRDLLGIRRYSMSGNTMRTMMLLKGALRSMEFAKAEEQVGNASNVSERANC